MCIRIWTILLVLLCIPTAVHGQKYFNNNFYLLNPYSHNMSYAGEHKELSISAQFAGQNDGLPTSPRTSYIFLHKGLGQVAGLGMRLMIDERGIFRNTRVMLESAYQVMIDPSSDHFIRLGIGGGANWENIDLSLIEQNGYTDLSDPMLYASNLRRSDIQFGTAMAYQFGGLEIGASAPFIIGIYSGQQDKASFWKYFSASAGYAFELAEDLRIKPFFIGQRIVSGLQLFDAVLHTEFLK